MANLTIPDGPAELTPEWLTCALRQTGTIKDARVISVDARPTGAGVGFIGQVVRVTLCYDMGEEGAPRSLIAKLPAS